MVITSEDLRIARSNKWICRSKITRAEVRKMGIPDCVTLREIRNVFDEMKGRPIVVGNPLNSRQQKHVKYVLKFALYRMVIKGV